jgi:predicted permease
MTKFLLPIFLFRFWAKKKQNFLFSRFASKRKNSKDFPVLFLFLFACLVSFGSVCFILSSDFNGSPRCEPSKKNFFSHTSENFFASDYPDPWRN